MKQFEKWWNSFNCEIGCDDTNCDDVCKEKREETWKVALEWVRNLPLQKDGPSRPKDLIRCIEKELEIEPYE